MAVGAVIKNYGDRQLDLFINFGINPVQPGAQNVTLTFGTVSKSCVGVQKLIQRYMIALLTNLGTQPSFPDFGTEFLSSLFGSNIVAPAELVHIFNFANLKVLQEFRAWQGKNPNTPPDERINTASLQDYTFYNSELRLAIRLVTDAGETVDFIMPLTIS